MTNTMVITADGLLPCFGNAKRRERDIVLRFLLQELEPDEGAEESTGVQIEISAGQCDANFLRLVI